MVFDDGKEASKSFLSEFYVINLKAWFLHLAPAPPQPATQCHLFCQEWEEVHIVPVTTTSLLLAYTHKWPLCLSFTKAILNVVQWRARGLHTVACKGKAIPWGEACLCFALEGPVFFFVLEVSANRGPGALQTRRH